LNSVSEMQSASQNAQRDDVLLGLHTDSHKHFSCPERNSMLWQFYAPNFSMHKDKSLLCIGYPWMFGDSIDARSVAVGNVRERG